MWWVYLDLPGHGILCCCVWWWGGISGLAVPICAVWSQCVVTARLCGTPESVAGESAAHKQRGPVGQLRGMGLSMVNATALG